MKWTISEIKLQITLAGGDTDRRKRWQDRLVIEEAREQRHQDKLAANRLRASVQRKEYQEAEIARNKEADRAHQLLKRGISVETAAEAAAEAFKAARRRG